MEITYTFKSHRIEVTQDIPEYPNAIYKVHWSIVFTDGVNESHGAGVSIFDVYNITSFTPIETVTDEDILQWLIDDEFGTNWGEYVAFHENEVRTKSRQPNLVVYYDDGVIQDGSV